MHHIGRVSQAPVSQAGEIDFLYHWLGLSGKTSDVSFVAGK
jgi:hypothetical protein